MSHGSASGGCQVGESTHRKYTTAIQAAAKQFDHFPRFWANYRQTGSNRVLVNLLHTRSGWATTHEPIPDPGQIDLLRFLKCHAGRISDQWTMDTYESRTEPVKLKLKHRLILVLCLAGTFFLVDLAWTLLTPDPIKHSRTLTSRVTEIGIVSLLWGAAMGFGSFSATSPHVSTLLVDEDSMTSVIRFTGWMSWLVLRRTVRRAMGRLQQSVCNRVLKVRSINGLNSVRP